ncbi:MAG TPA: hypothetical protein VF691_04225 [Cytophagaceae bacterium]|jgi:hypothetical protein
MTSKLVFKKPAQPKTPLSIKILPILGLLIGVFIAFKMHKTKSVWLGYGLAGGVLCALPLAVFQARKSKKPLLKTVDITPLAETKSISSPDTEASEGQTSSFLDHGML